jgi:hypothetical protein
MRKAQRRRSENDSFWHFSLAPRFAAKANVPNSPKFLRDHIWPWRSSKCRPIGSACPFSPLSLKGLDSKNSRALLHELSGAR